MFFVLRIFTGTLKIYLGNAKYTGFRLKRLNDEKETVPSKRVFIVTELSNIALNDSSTMNVARFNRTRVKQDPVSARSCRTRCKQGAL